MPPSVVSRSIKSVSLALGIMVALSGCAGLQAQMAWSAATREDTPEAYSRFVEAFPQSRLLGEARKRLAAARDRVVQEAWREAQRLDSEASYEQFMVRYPTSPLLPQAARRLEAVAFDQQLEVLRTRAQEQGSFAFRARTSTTGTAPTETIPFSLFLLRPSDRGTSLVAKGADGAYQRFTPSGVTVLPLPEGLSQPLLKKARSYEGGILFLDVSDLASETFPAKTYAPILRHLRGSIAKSRGRAASTVAVAVLHPGDYAKAPLFQNESHNEFLDRISGTLVAGLLTPEAIGAQLASTDETLSRRALRLLRLAKYEDELQVASVARARAPATGPTVGPGPHLPARLAALHVEFLSAASDASLERYQRLATRSADLLVELGDVAVPELVSVLKKSPTATVTRETLFRIVPAETLLGDLVATRADVVDRAATLLEIGRLHPGFHEALLDLCQDPARSAGASCAAALQRLAALHAQHLRVLLSSSNAAPAEIDRSTAVLARTGEPGLADVLAVLGAHRNWAGGRAIALRTFDAERLVRELGGAPDLRDRALGLLSMGVAEPGYHERLVGHCQTLAAGTAGPAGCDVAARALAPVHAERVRQLLERRPASLPDIRRSTALLLTVGDAATPEWARLLNEESSRLAVRDALLDDHSPRALAVLQAHSAPVAVARPPASRADEMAFLGRLGDRCDPGIALRGVPTRHVEAPGRRPAASQGKARPPSVLDHLSVLGDVEVAHYDDSARELLLIGPPADASGPLTRDEWIAVVRSVARAGGPGVTIEPTADPDKLAVIYFGGVEETGLGRTLFEADRRLKILASGFDNSDCSVAPPAMKPFMTYIDTLEVAARQSTGEHGAATHRFWITHSQDPSRRSSAGFTLKLPARRLVVKQEALGPVLGPDTAAASFADQLSRNYLALASHIQPLRDLHRLAGLVRIVKWLLATGLAADAAWLQDWPAAQATPDSTPGITVSRSTIETTPLHRVHRRIRISGGVELATEPAYATDDRGGGGLARAALQARGGNQTSWQFVFGTRSYRALSLRYANPIRLSPPGAVARASAVDSGGIPSSAATSRLLTLDELSREASSLAGSCPRVARPTVRGEAQVWDQTKDKSELAATLLPPSLRVHGSTALLTVFVVYGRRNVEVGRYTISGQPAYREELDVAVVRWPEGTCMGRMSISGGDPPSRRVVRYTPEYGSSVNLAKAIEGLDREP